MTSSAVATAVDVAIDCHSCASGLPTTTHSKDRLVEYAKAFASSTLCLWAITSQTLQADTTCSHGHIDATARVAHVYDGDTVKLGNGDKVRLIGINAPETGYRKRPSQAFASRAKKRLSQLLRQHHNEIKLRYGQQRRDRYQRLLAYGHLPSGKNIGAVLLSEGLATQVVIPPNLSYRDCYRRAEQKAQNAKRGLWSKHITNVSDLKPSVRGFRLIKGRITGFNKTRKHLSITLDRHLRLQIKKVNRHYFSADQLSDLPGKAVLVRGWINGYDHQLIMNLPHPDNLQLIDERV